MSSPTTTSLPRLPRRPYCRREQGARVDVQLQSYAIVRLAHVAAKFSADPRAPRSHAHGRAALRLGPDEQSTRRRRQLLLQRCRAQHERLDCQRLD